MQEPNVVELHDSMLSTPSTDLQLQIAKVYGCLTKCVNGPPNFGSLMIAAQPVHQQGATLDCGVFAIAFATDLEFELKSSTSWYDVTAMRQHLESCLQARRLTQFPQLQVDEAVKVNSQLTFDVELHCLCRMPQQHGVMELCETCGI